MNKLYISVISCVLLVTSVITTNKYSFMQKAEIAFIQDNHDVMPTIQPIEISDDQINTKITNNIRFNNKEISNSNIYDKKYYIKVNTRSQIVTIYKYNISTADYVEFKNMICSTGKILCSTPEGIFKIYARYNWLKLVGGSYGQYCVRFNGQILFHSIPYLSRDPYSLMKEEYNKIGTPASLGCVRLQVADAKWIYDNCSDGTAVEVYNGANDKELSENLKPEKLKENVTWDPSDPIIMENRIKDHSLTD